MSFKDLMTYKRILIRHIYTSVISWWHVRFQSKQTWELIFSAMWTCPIPTTTDFEIHRFLQTCVPPFLKTDLAIHFAQIWTCPFATQHIWNIKFLRNLVCPISTKTDVDIDLFSNGGMFHFHQNRRANSSFPRNLGCPISSETDLDIHLFCNAAIPNSHQNYFVKNLGWAGLSPIIFHWNRIEPVQPDLLKVPKKMFVQKSGWAGSTRFFLNVAKSPQNSPHTFSLRLPRARSSVRFCLKPENLNSHGFELHRSSIKVVKLLLKVTKAIIITQC